MMIKLNTETNQSGYSSGGEKSFSSVSFVFVDCSGNRHPADRTPAGIFEYNDLLHKRAGSLWMKDFLAEGIDGVAQLGFETLDQLRKYGVVVTSPLYPMDIVNTFPGIESADGLSTAEKKDLFLKRMVAQSRYHLGAAVVGAEAECMAQTRDIIRSQGLGNVEVELRTDVNYDNHRITVVASYPGHSYDAVAHIITQKGKSTERDTRFIEAKDKKSLFDIVTNIFNLGF